MDSDIIMEFTFAILIVFVAIFFIAIVLWIVGILQKIFCAIKRSDTKRKKLIILWSGTFIIVIMCFFPPFITDSGAVSYAHLFSDKINIIDQRHTVFRDYEAVSAHIYFVRLIIQCAIVGLITGVLYFTLGMSKESEPIISVKNTDRTDNNLKRETSSAKFIDNDIFIKGFDKLKIGDTVTEVLSLIGKPAQIQRDGDGRIRWIYEKAKTGAFSSTIYSHTLVISDNKVVDIILDPDL